MVTAASIVIVRALFLRRLNLHAGQLFACGGVVAFVLRRPPWELQESLPPKFGKYFDGWRPLVSPRGNAILYDPCCIPSGAVGTYALSDAVSSISARALSGAVVLHIATPS